MGLFSKKHENLLVEVNQELIGNARVIVEEINVLKKLLAELKAKNSEFISFPDKLTEIINKYDGCKLQKELNSILNAKTPLLGDSEMTVRLCRAFTGKFSDGLKANIKEMDTILGLTGDFVSNVHGSQKVLVDKIKAKGMVINDDEIQSVNNMKDVDVFIKSIVEANKRLGDALHRCVEILKEILDVKWGESVSQQARRM